MCLAIPGKIEKIENEKATVDYDGIKKEANISLVNCKINDYILVHAGFAIEKIDKKKAHEVYNLLHTLTKKDE